MQRNKKVWMLLVGMLTGTALRKKQQSSFLMHSPERWYLKTVSALLYSAQLSQSDPAPRWMHSGHCTQHDCLPWGGRACSSPSCTVLKLPGEWLQRQPLFQGPEEQHWELKEFWGKLYFLYSLTPLGNANEMPRLATHLFTVVFALRVENCTIHRIFYS